MLMNLHKRKWTQGLALPRFEAAKASDEGTLAELAKHAAAYAVRAAEEEGKTATEISVAAVGKVDPRRRLEEECSALLARDISQGLGAALQTTMF